VEHFEVEDDDAMNTHELPTPARDDGAPSNPQGQLEKRKGPPRGTGLSRGGIDLPRLHSEPKLDHGDGSAEAEIGDEEEDAEDTDGDSREAEVAPELDGAWPIVHFDVALLTDPAAGHEARDAEWKKVFRGFDPYLRYYFASLGPYDEMDDVVAAIWRRAVRKIHTLKDQTKAIFWLIKIGRNQLRDAEKAQTRRLERQRKFVDSMIEDDEDWRDAIHSKLTEESLFDDRIDRKEFRRRFSELSDLDQEFAVLLKIDGLSHRDIVTRLGLKSEDASKARWQWMKKKLKKTLIGSSDS